MTFLPYVGLAQPVDSVLIQGCLSLSLLRWEFKKRLPAIDEEPTKAVEVVA